MIRNKLTLRRRPQSSHEILGKDCSLERLNDSRMVLFKYQRPLGPGNDSFKEVNECSKSDSDFVEEKKTLRLTSGSSIESCARSREHIPLSRKSESVSRKYLSLSGEHSSLSGEHSPFPREQDHSDSDDSTTHDHTSRRDGDDIDDKNQRNRRTLRQSCKDDTTGQLTRKKLGKKNSFTNAVRYFFVQKMR